MGRQSLPTYMRPLPSKALVIEEGPKSRWPGATYSMQHKVVRSFMRFPQLTILIYQVEGLVSIHTCWYHSICQYVFFVFCTLFCSPAMWWILQYLQFTTGMQYLFVYFP